jgi:hypothetical protein
MEERGHYLELLKAKLAKKKEQFNAELQTASYFYSNILPKMSR